MRPPATSSGINPREDVKLNNVFEILEIEDGNLSSHEDDQEEEAGHERGSSDKENIVSRKPRKTKKRKQIGKGKKTGQSKKTEDQVAIIQNPITDLDIVSPAKEYEITINDEDELYFMIYCIFLDFNKIREWIQELWYDYQDGLCTLAAVSVATDTAFDLLQRVEKAILRENPRLQFKELAMMLFINGGLAHVDYEVQNRRTKAGGSIDDDLFEESDWLSLDIYKILSDWVEMTPPGKVPIARWHNRDLGMPDMPDFETHSRREATPHLGNN